jgi:DNA-binding response OmpR family regulator
MIFIVDDDRSVRISLTRLMRSADYEARAFASAEEYLRDVEWARTGAGCVILDLHMPGMSGLELQEVINRREPAVPVIVLTASQDAEFRAKALVAGAARVLRKPCDATVLLRAVAAAIGQSPPPSPSCTCAPTQTSTGSAELDSSGTGSEDLDHFVVEEGRGVYRPEGYVSFDQAVALVRAAIALARRHQLPDLLVNTTALTGFPSPDTFERFLAVTEWAEEAREGVRLAIVARAELIHPQKFGVIVAANRGLVSNIFTTECEARAWLAALGGE